jgi:hypothetical protein
MEITEAQKNQIISKVELVLRDSFSGPKSEIKLHRDRLNFACPYCGDSTHVHKKRANIYWKNLIFHCFNDGCGKHTNLVSFLRDYDRGVTNTDDLTFYLDYIRTNQVVVPTKEYLEVNVFQSLKDYSIPLDVIKKKLNLQTTDENMRIEKYLKSRFMHHRLEHFMYSEKSDQLYIFNLTADKKSTIGWQIRNFGHTRTKYVSFNIEKINHLVLDKKIDLSEEEIIKMNTLSLFFGIFYTDFSKFVTVFEGPIDSFLLSNSIAITGSDKPTDMFDEISTIRYLFDNDPAGRRVMESKLKRKKRVFMWNKLFKDFKIQPRLANMKGIKDLNDLIEYCWKTKNEAIKNLDRYYTDNPLDIRDV